MSFTYSGGVFVALGVQHEMCMRHIVICCQPHSAIFFFTLCHEGYDFRKRKKLLKINSVFWFPPQFRFFISSAILCFDFLRNFVFWFPPQFCVFISSTILCFDFLYNFMFWFPPQFCVFISSTILCFDFLHNFVFWFPLQFCVLISSTVLCFDFLYNFVFWFPLQFYVWISSTILSETYLILRRIERDMIKYVYRSLCKLPVILVRF